MNNVVLSLHPGAEPISWTEFCKTHPRFSIALDGYVSGMSRYDRRCPWLTLDHHADVDRLSARATCAQVLLCIRQGLFDAFRDEQGRRATVHANDCDEDVCLSWFLLRNPELGLLSSHTRLNRLVQAVDVLDTTAGASLHALNRALTSELAWVFEPYREARMLGALDVPLAEVQSGIIATVSNRIREHLMGKGGMVAPDTCFQQIGGGKGWSMVREIGAQARAGMIEAGIRAYVSVRPRVDGAWAYAVGRASPFVPFDVLAILRGLNAAEDPTRGTWGGGNLVGGSPRLHGSGLSPVDISRIVGRVLARAHSQRQPEDSPVLVA
jgi:hypothetical protein